MKHTIFPQEYPNKTEQWGDIPGYEGLYKVSTHGNIKSLPRNGTTKTPRVLLLKTTQNNRKEVGLNKNNIKTSHLVHRLVAKTFIPNPTNKPCINHKDGNPQNNNLSNLEWCTYSENMSHAFRTGLHSLKGDRHNNRKLNSDQVREIRALWATSPAIMHKDIAKKYGVCRSMITLITNNKNWINC